LEFIASGCGRLGLGRLGLGWGHGIAVRTDFQGRRRQVFIGK
jgi:hypothetical protein